MQRRGKWIWRDRGVPFLFSSLAGRIDPKLDANLFVQFRRAFHIDEMPPLSALLRISADGRYQLYVNGVRIGRGPARCEPLYQYYDEYDIAPFLGAGENVVAVLAHSYGRDMSWYELPRADWARQLGCGGIFVECDALHDLDSDARWRYAIAEAWERDTPGGGVGFVEIYDARRADDGWTQPGFDDAAWTNAIVLATPGVSIGEDVVLFPHMVPRDIPPLLEQPRDAVRVVSVAELAVADPSDIVAIAEAAPEPLSACGVEDADALLASGAAATKVRLAAGRAVTIVVDFGRDVSGYPRLELAGPAGATIDVSYCERLREDGRARVQRANVITSQNVHRYILREGEQAWETFERAGFRYLQLTVSPAPDRPDAPVRIRRANVNFTSYLVGNRGSFACSDADLTRIWNAGAYTLQLCMQDGFEDCPSREQRQWVGDAYVESMVNYACFGDARLTAKEIRQVAQSQRRDGMTQMATPSDLGATNGLYIADYCLAWIMTAGDYLLHTGDTSVVDDVFPNVARAVAWFEHHVGDDGLLWNVPGWIFNRLGGGGQARRAGIAERALRAGARPGVRPGRPSARRRARRALARDRRPHRHRREPPAVGRRAGRLRRRAAARRPRPPRVAAVERRDDHIRHRAARALGPHAGLRDGRRAPRRDEHGFRAPAVHLDRRGAASGAGAAVLHALRAPCAGRRGPPRRDRAQHPRALAADACRGRHGHVLGALARPRQPLPRLVRHARLRPVARSARRDAARPRLRAVPRRAAHRGPDVGGRPLSQRARRHRRRVAARGRPLRAGDRHAAGRGVRSRAAAGLHRRYTRWPDGGRGVAGARGDGAACGGGGAGG
jgi:hypothetical protein